MPEAAHSKYSASGFEAARLCPGKPVLELGKPDSSSAYAREGTAAHALLEMCILNNQRAEAYAGRLIEVEGDEIEVDDEMVGHVNWCLDAIADYAGPDGMVLAETRVNYAEDIGVAEAEAWGTSDVIIVRGTEVVSMDLKYGRGVEVDPNCDQTKLYLLGALRQVDGIVADIDHCRAVILQPRLSHTPVEWDCTVAELRQWAATVAWDAVEQRQQAAQWSEMPASLPAEFLRPGEKQCRFCKAKATCPALRDEVTETVHFAPATPEEFAEKFEPANPREGSDPHWIAACLSKVDLIEGWCKAVRAEAERRLLAGEPVPGFKVVQGKRGARQWADPKVAEETLKAMRVKLEDMYDFKLISPTTAEKLHKAGTIGPRQWPRVKDLITQNEGKPHVAPATDSRPALVVTPVADDFTDVTAEDLA
jgi:hypothetical protein